MTCPNCGRELKKVSKFCLFCGFEMPSEETKKIETQIKSDQVSDEKRQAELYIPPVSKPDNRKKYLIIGLITLLVAVAIGLAIFVVMKKSSGSDDSGNSADYTIPVEAVEFQDHSYLIVQDDEITDFDQANDYCKSNGGYLASITSAEENDFVARYIASSDYTYVFVGGSDKFSEGSWSYVNGESSSFSKWAEGEPNSETDDEDYLLIDGEGFWNDAIFNGKYSGNAFLCEWDYVTGNGFGSNESTSPISEQSVNSETLSSALSPVAYYGHKANCKLTPSMVQAYEKVLNQLPETKSIQYMFNDGKLTAALIDISGDGYPLLATSYLGYNEDFEEEGNGEISLWEYRDGKAQLLSPESELWVSGFGVLRDMDPYHLAFSAGEMQDIVGGTDLIIYNVSNGAANYEGTYKYRGGYSEEGSSTVDYYDTDDVYKTGTRSELLQKGWEIDEYGNADCLFYNGQKSDRSYESIMRAFDSIAYFDYSGYLQITFTPVQTMLDAFDAMLGNKTQAAGKEETSALNNTSQGIKFVKDVDGNLNVRSEPTHESSLVTSISDDRVLTYENETQQGLGSDGVVHDWYKITVDGYHGWVRSDLIKKT